MTKDAEEVSESGAAGLGARMEQSMTPVVRRTRERTWAWRSLRLRRRVAQMAVKSILDWTTTAKIGASRLASATYSNICCRLYVHAGTRSNIDDFLLLAKKVGMEERGLLSMNRM